MTTPKYPPRLVADCNPETKEAARRAASAAGGTVAELLRGAALESDDDRELATRLVGRGREVSDGE